MGFPWQNPRGESESLSPPIHPPTEERNHRFADDPRERGIDRRHERSHRRRGGGGGGGEMGVMGRLRVFVVQEPVVAASCLIAGFGLFLPAVVRPILDSYETTSQVPQPALTTVVAGVTGKK